MPLDIGIVLKASKAMGPPPKRCPAVATLRNVVDKEALCCAAIAVSKCTEHATLVDFEERDRGPIAKVCMSDAWRACGSA